MCRLFAVCTAFFELNILRHSAYLTNHEEKKGIIIERTIIARYFKENAYWKHCLRVRGRHNKFFGNYKLESRLNSNRRFQINVCILNLIKIHFQPMHYMNIVMKMCLCTTY